jgi:hypothetical protein
MTKHQTGPKNGQWKGGRSVASNGYVLIRVGIGHHLADVRGYAYEHRLVAEQMLGRRLRPGEQVHHRDENKENNAPGNLEVVASLAEHRLRHRSAASSRRLPSEANHAVECACGCGAQIDAFDRWGRRRRFVSGHNGRALA